MVDYFSRHPEENKLHSTTSAHIISILKDVFERHGILEVFRSDNSPQYVNEAVKQMANYRFQHVTSSPYYPRGNEPAERTAQSCENAHPVFHEAVPGSFWHTRQHSYSGSTFLLHNSNNYPEGRGAFSTDWHISPSSDRLLHNTKESRGITTIRDRVSMNYHSCQMKQKCGLPVTSGGTPQHGTVIQKAHTPRSHVISTPKGEGRRNRSQVKQYTLYQYQNPHWIRPMVHRNP